MKPVLENYAFLVYVYYMHPGYQTSIWGKNRAYYIQIFTVHIMMCWKRLLAECSPDQQT